MTATKVMLKSSDSDAYLKVKNVGGADSVNIEIDDFLYRIFDDRKWQIQQKTETSRVGIASIIWSSEKGKFKITRGGDDSEHLVAIGTNGGSLIFGGQSGYIDYDHADKPIKIEVEGDICVWIKFKKSGFRNFNENDRYGIYDDETKIGPTYKIND